MIVTLGTLDWRVGTTQGHLKKGREEEREEGKTKDKSTLCPDLVPQFGLQEATQHHLRFPR